VGLGGPNVGGEWLPASVRKIRSALLPGAFGDSVDAAPSSAFPMKGAIRFPRYRGFCRSAFGPPTFTRVVRWESRGSKSGVADL
jgi:hypothetical protein